MKKFNQGSLIFNLILTAFVVMLILISFKYKPEIQQVHLIISIPTLFFLILLIFKELFPNIIKLKDVTNQKQTDWINIFRIGGWIIIFSIAIFLFGFYLSILVFCFLFLIIEGKLKWYKSLSMTILLSLSVYIFFQRTLNVIMWPGVIPEIFDDFLGGGILPPL